MEGSTCSSLPVESDGLTEVQASQPQRTLGRWEDKHVRLLIESYLQFKGLVGQANTKKSVFDKIAAEFNKHAERGLERDRSRSRSIRPHEIFELWPWNFGWMDHTPFISYIATWPHKGFRSKECNPAIYAWAVLLVYYVTIHFKATFKSNE